MSIEITIIIEDDKYHDVADIVDYIDDALITEGVRKFTVTPAVEAVPGDRCSCEYCRKYAKSHLIADMLIDGVVIDLKLSKMNTEDILGMPVVKKGNVGKITHVKGATCTCKRCSPRFEEDLA